MTNDPKNPEYNAKARDAIMDLCPFYDPNHKCGVVRDHVFKDCLAELRERERLALERVRALESELTNLLEWDNFPPGYVARERALKILGQND